MRCCAVLRQAPAARSARRSFVAVCSAPGTAPVSHATPLTAAHQILEGERATRRENRAEDPDQKGHGKAHGSAILPRPRMLTSPRADEVFADLAPPRPLAAQEVSGTSARRQVAVGQRYQLTELCTSVILAT